MPAHDLLDYYTEAMTVPFYEVKPGQKLSELAAEADMKPTSKLAPMTPVLAEKKPRPPDPERYIVAQVDGGAKRGTWGMIWSGHLRQARHIGERMPTGQTLTGASYGTTKNSIEVPAGDPWDDWGKGSEWHGRAVPNAGQQADQGPRCLRCNSPMRGHKVYESVEARDLLVSIGEAAEKGQKGEGGSLMIGMLLVFDKGNSLTCIVGAESGWVGTGYQSAFELVVGQRHAGALRIWANELLKLQKVAGVEKLDDNAMMRDFKGTTSPMKSSKLAMSCAGPKLIQAYLKWDEESGRRGRGVDALYMSEIYGRGDAPAKAGKGELGVYGPRQSASSCMKCRSEIPPMLCGKAPALAKADVPHLLLTAEHA
jgi:hypothetical protein